MGQPLRVALIEDNADAREMLRMLVESEGHRVTTAADGETGLALIVKQSPDVALVDIGLPRLDGYALARKVREALPARDICLVALTGYGRPEDVARAHDAGFDRHLTKPIDLDTLHAILQDVAERGAGDRSATPSSDSDG